jgi:hypothetical protein
MTRTFGRGVFVALACGVLVAVAQAQQPPGVGTPPPPPPSSGTLPPPALDHDSVPPTALPRDTVPVSPAGVPTPTPPSSGPLPPTAPPSPFLEGGPVPTSALPRPANPPTATIDDVLSGLERIKKQREALDQHEKRLSEQLKGLLKAQQERMTRLGLNEPKVTEAKTEVFEVPVPSVPRTVEAKK